MAHELAWDPVVEPAGEGAFLCEHPAAIAAAGRQADVPFLTGINSREGLLWVLGECGYRRVQSSTRGWKLLHGGSGHARTHCFSTDITKLSLPGKSYRKTGLVIQKNVNCYSG